MNFNAKKRKSTLEKTTIELGMIEDSKFEFEDLIDVLSKITFNMININLNMKKSDLGMPGKGYTPIGFVNKFYENENEEYVFDVAIFDNFKHVLDIHDDFKVNYVIVRAFTNKDNKITKIIGLDLMRGDVE